MKNIIRSSIAGLTGLVLAATANLATADTTNTTYNTTNDTEYAASSNVTSSTKSTKSTSSVPSPYVEPTKYETKKTLVTSDQILQVYFNAEWTDLFTGESKTGTVVRAYEADGVTPAPLVRDLRLSYGDSLEEGLTRGDIIYKKGDNLGANLETGKTDKTYFLKAEFLEW